MTLKVKICGITSAADAEAALTAGADALGLVFYPASPRNISLDHAVAVARVIGPFHSLVGLFVNPDPQQVMEVLAAVPLNLLQFHGDETADFCESFSRPYIKAIRIKPGIDIPREISRFPSARGFLMDAWDPAQYGGTGTAFDWRMIPSNLDRPIILAGGLTADNIAQAVAVVRPYGVDVSSGVESAPGKKSAAQMQRFVANARN